MRYQSKDLNFGKCRKVVLPSTGVEVYKTGGLILFHLLLERKRGLLLLDNPELLDQTRWLNFEIHDHLQGLFTRAYSSLTHVHSLEESVSVKKNCKQVERSIFRSFSVFLGRMVFNPRQKSTLVLNIQLQGLALSYSTQLSTSRFNIQS